VRCTHSHALAARQPCPLDTGRAASGPQLSAASPSDAQRLGIPLPSPPPPLPTQHTCSRVPRHTQPPPHPHTCRLLQSKPGVSSMCCSSRPGVATSTFMLLTTACSSRTFLPPESKAGGQGLAAGLDGRPQLEVAAAWLDWAAPGGQYADAQGPGLGNYGSRSHGAAPAKARSIGLELCRQRPGRAVAACSRAVTTCV
jgi:hypothetical protein